MNRAPWTPSTWLCALLLALLTVMASGSVSAKVASGPQHLTPGLHQGQSLFKLLPCQGKSQSSTTVALGCSVVPKGPTVYRQGTFADDAIDWKGNYVKGKQWAADNPLTTPDYAKKYGLPAENTGSPDWIVKGRVEGPYSTRPAPASHNNPANTGGGTEVLPNNPNDVKLDWFHMPD